MNQTLFRTDPVFWESFKKGDQKAFKVMYDDTVKFLLAFAYKTTRGFARQDELEDMVTTAYVYVFNNRERYKNYNHLKANLYLHIKCKGIDWLRDRKKRKKAINEYAYLIGEDVDTIQLANVDNIDHLGFMYEALKTLHPQRRAVIKHLFFGGLDTSQIAKVMNLSPQTVLNHKSKAIHIMQKLAIGREIKLKEISAKRF